jgi:hypothetical protein
VIKFDEIYDRWKQLAILGGANLVLTIGFSSATVAQSNLTPPSPVICDLNLDLLKSAATKKDRNIVTADTVSPQGITMPSLWWTSEEFPPKLVTNWIANRRQNQIYLLVNSQYWNILDYIDRYRTIDKFGRVAQSYGYNLTICNSQKITLAAYNCESTVDTSVVPAPAYQNICQVWLNVNGQKDLGVLSIPGK